MKLTKKLAILLAVVGILAVFASVAVLMTAMRGTQPSTGIIGGADLPTMLLMLRQSATSAVGWLMASGMLCLIASLVTAIVGAVANKR